MHGARAWIRHERHRLRDDARRWERVRDSKRAQKMAPGARPDPTAAAVVLTRNGAGTSRSEKTEATPCLVAGGKSAATPWVAASIRNRASPSSPRVYDTSGEQKGDTNHPSLKIAFG